MPFKPSYNAALGLPPVNLQGVNTLAGVAIGTIIRGFDDLLGEGEFVYLPGVAGLNAGDHVVYDLTPANPTVTRSTVATAANSGQPSGVAVAAVPAGSYGWFQISGCAIVNIAGAGVVGRAFVTATAGSLSSAATAGSQLIGARISTAVGTPGAGQSYVTLNRPSVQSQIT